MKPSRPFLERELGESLELGIWNLGFGAWSLELGPPKTTKYRDSLQQLRLLLFLDEQFSEAFHAGAASFHDVFFEIGIVGHRVISIKAGHAEGVFGKSGRFDHAIEGQVGE